MNKFTEEVSFLEEEQIYFHSQPASSRLYDSIWTEQRDFKFEDYRSFEKDQRNSIANLSKLFLPSSQQSIQFQKNIEILDVCSGHGKYSFAAIEMGAGKVFSCDGSRKSLSRISNLINKNIDYQKFRNKIIPVQADVEKISRVFFQESFDIVFQRFAIHHMRNPMQTAYELSSFVKPGGLLCFNYFASGCTPQIIRDLRGHFLTKNVDYVRSLFQKIEYLKSENKKDLLEKLIFQTEKEKTDHFESILFLRELCEKYDFNVLLDRIHYEDANTPFIHNIDREKMMYFVTEILGLVIVDRRDTEDEQSLTLSVPKTGVRKIQLSEIPDTLSFSPENIKLGDSLIRMMEK